MHDRLACQEVDSTSNCKPGWQSQSIQETFIVSRTLFLKDLGMLKFIFQVKWAICCFFKWEWFAFGISTQLLGFHVTLCQSTTWFTADIRYEWCECSPSVAFTDELATSYDEESHVNVLEYSNITWSYWTRSAQIVHNTWTENKGLELYEEKRFLEGLQEENYHNCKRFNCLE